MSGNSRASLPRFLPGKWNTVNRVLHCKSSWLGQCLTSGSIFGHSRDDFSMTSRLQHLQCLITTTHQEFHHQQSKEQSRVITYQKKTKSNSRHWTIQVLNLTLNLNLGCRETNHYTPEYDVVWGGGISIGWGKRSWRSKYLKKCRYQLEFSMLAISSFAALHVPL